jgi:hypothetical protein
MNPYKKGMAWGWGRRGTVYLREDLRTVLFSFFTNNLFLLHLLLGRQIYSSLFLASTKELMLPNAYALFDHFLISTHPPFLVVLGFKLTLARQVLYHLSYSTSPFLCWVFLR